MLPAQHSNAEAQRLAAITPSCAPDDPVLIRKDIVERQRGTHHTALRQYSVSNADGTPDPHAEWNLTVAKAITRVLLNAYPGHFWEVYVDRSQKLATITIPLLLGNWKYRLSSVHEIMPQDIIRAGGEILERFNIPRSSLNIADFINAKKLAVSRLNQIPPGGMHKAKR